MPTLRKIMPTYLQTFFKVPALVSPGKNSRYQAQPGNEVIEALPQPKLTNAQKFTAKQTLLLRILAGQSSCYQPQIQHHS